MPYRRSCAVCALAAALLLSGCSAVTGSDVESLLRAPQASGGAHLKAAGRLHAAARFFRRPAAPETAQGPVPGPRGIGSRAV